MVKKNSNTFEPTEPPDSRLNLSVSDLHALNKGFKELFEGTRLEWYVIWAGRAAIGAFFLELLHLIWLGARYVWKW
jgi:hypothetical protein